MLNALVTQLPGCRRFVSVVSSHVQQYAWVYDNRISFRVHVDARRMLPLRLLMREITFADRYYNTGIDPLLLKY